MKLLRASKFDDIKKKVDDKTDKTITKLDEGQEKED